MRPLRTPLNPSLPLMNGVTSWRHGCGQMCFPGTSYNVSSLLVEASTFKQAIKLTFAPNKFGKGLYKIYRPEYISRKGHVIMLIKSLTSFTYQKVFPM